MLIFCFFTEGGFPMRKVLLLAVLMLVFLMPAALADTHTFSEGYFSIDLNPKDYDKVLTPYNLSANQEWIESQGEDYQIVVNTFENEGILLKAYDNKNNRIFVVTALQNWDAQQYFDLNEQDDDMRKEFRQSHTNGSAYGVLGYSYSKAAWKKYDNDVNRILHTKYSLKENGTVSCTGYQRRTIRNGYTITLDMQVYGRKAGSSDEKALETIMKTLRFTRILPMPDLPIKLNFTSAPPQETSEATFTVKGTTAKKANVTATVMSFGSSKAQTYTDTASSSGAFSFKVTLPSQGVYTITVTAEKEGSIAAQRMFSVTFQKGILAVQLDVLPGESLNDETIISGSTEKGATTQVSVTGPIDYTKTSTSQNFSFKIDTSAEGKYTILLKVTKKGMNERLFTFTCTRSYTDTERSTKLKTEARSLSYQNLSKAANKGKLVELDGYVAAVTPNASEHVVQFALSKSKENYKEICYVIFPEDPAVSPGDEGVLYGMAAGTYSVISEDGVKMYPRIEGYFIEKK